MQKKKNPNDPLKMYSHGIFISVDNAKPNGEIPHDSAMWGDGDYLGRCAAQAADRNNEMMAFFMFVVDVATSGFLTHAIKTGAVERWRIEETKR